MIRNRRKEREGVVISNKCDKTITVLITYRVKHPIYGKFIKMSKKFAVHDENNVCNVGDVVAIMETRPLSKTKKWRFFKILKSATQ